MAELIKKTLLVGLGLALRTWDEVESVAKELVEKGKMPKKEGDKFLKDLQRKYEETQKSLEARAEKSVKDFFKKANVATRDDLKALKKEIKDLKKTVEGKSRKS